MDALNPTKPTKRMIEFLYWAKTTGDYTIWPVAWSVMHRKARAAGFVEPAPSRGVMAGYRISKIGLKALGEVE